MRFIEPSKSEPLNPPYVLHNWKLVPLTDVGVEDALYLGIDLLLQDHPQQLHGLGGVRHDGALAPVHGNLVVIMELAS